MQKTLLAVIAAAVVSVGLSVNFALGAAGEQQPADKVSAAGSEAEVLAAGTSVPILEEQVRTSNTADLILSLTAECVLTTELTTVGNDLANTEGKVEMQVKIDGDPVPVSQDDTDNGKVVFCNRFEERQVSAADDEEMTIRTLQRTRDATGFNWLALNVGNGIHDIEVTATFTEDTTATDGGTALAAVGNRTLMVQPTHAANNEVVTLSGQ